MKKTVMINLGGIVFHIDEDAYALLNHYLENLKKHFSKQEGAQDILNDIESRIAEILTEKRPETKQVITAEDVDDVIAIMGNPVEIEQEENTKKPQDAGENLKGDKRFFRNPDAKVIAGVCSGIGAWFHLDPVWVRLIFVLFLLAGGSGILVYLVLWIVIPEAQTTSDKLEMRGEKVNIRNIDRSIRAEVSELGARVGHMASESAATLRRAGSGSGVFFEGVGKGIVQLLSYFWTGLVFLTGITLALAGLGLLLILLTYVFGWSDRMFWDAEFSVLSLPKLANLTIGCSMPVIYLQLVLTTVVGIPAFMIFYNGLRMVFRFNRIKHLGFTMFNIWIVGIFLMAWTGMRIYNLYKFTEEKQIEIALEKPGSDTLNINLMADDPGLKYLRNEKLLLVDDQKAILTGDHEILLVPGIRFEETSDSLFSVTQFTLARGKTRMEARQHMAAIRFQSAAMGTSLKLGPYARLQKEECWRGESVNLLIHVPKGKFVRFDQQFHDLKPDWYYMMNSSEESIFKMTENGVELTTSASDSISSPADTVK